MSVGITRSALREIGVELVDRGRLHLRCMSCGHGWKIEQGADTRRPNHYQKCRVCHPEVDRILRRAREKRALRFNTRFATLSGLRDVA